MLILQILVSLFVLSNIFRIFRQARAEKISYASWLWWSLLWLIVLIVFWLPDSTSYLAQLLGITRGADLMVYLSVLLIFYLLYKIFVRFNRIEDAITKVVRQKALDQKKDNAKR